VREFNRELLRRAELTRAEMLLVYKGWWVRAETLDELRSRGVACYNYYPDVSFVAHGPYIPEALPRYDWVFTSKSFHLRDLPAQLGVTRVSLLQLAFDRDLHRPVELTAEDRRLYDCQVSYNGSYSPKREEVMRGLILRRPDLDIKVFGPGWHRAHDRAALGRALRGPMPQGEDYVRATCASQINVAIMSEVRRGASRGDQVAKRTFDMPACGGFVLHERTDELLELFREDEEVACWSDADELAEKVDVYLADPARRRAIAERARARVAGRDSWDHRIADILAHHQAATGSA
jgi:spore maturation protein CgeB